MSGLRGAGGEKKTHLHCGRCGFGLCCGETVTIKLLSGEIFNI